MQFRVGEVRFLRVPVIFHRPLRYNPGALCLGFQYTRLVLRADFYRRACGHHPRRQQHTRDQPTRSNNTGNHPTTHAHTLRRHITPTPRPVASATATPAGDTVAVSVAWRYGYDSGTELMLPRERWSQGSSRVKVLSADFPPPAVGTNGIEPVCRFFLAEEETLLRCSLAKEPSGFWGSGLAVTKVAVTPPWRRTVYPFFQVDVSPGFFRLLALGAATCEEETGEQDYAGSGDHSQPRSVAGCCRLT